MDPSPNDGFWIFGMLASQISAKKIQSVLKEDAH